MIVIYVTRGIVWFTWQSGKTRLPFLCAAFYIIKNLIPKLNAWVQLFVFLTRVFQSGAFTHKNKFVLVGRIKQKICHGKDTQYRTLNLFGNISMGVRKKAICIISNSRELFLSLRRALRLSFPMAVFYFYDTGIVEKGRLDDIESPRYKKAGILIADFLHESEESLREF